MPVNTFVKMLIRVEGLPTKATNIGPPLTISILIRVLIIHVCKNIKTVDTGVNFLKLAHEKGHYKHMLNNFAMYKRWTSPNQFICMFIG